MINLHELAEEMEISPSVLFQSCTMMGIEIINDCIPDAAADKLIDLNAAAIAEGKTLLEAAQEFSRIHQAKAQSSPDERFDIRKYFHQRFGVDPETQAHDSVVGILYHQYAKAAETIADTGSAMVRDLTLRLLHDRLKNGSPVNNRTVGDSQAAIAQAEESLDSFFIQAVPINWGQTEHPALQGTSHKQLTGS